MPVPLPCAYLQLCLRFTSCVNFPGTKEMAKHFEIGDTDSDGALDGLLASSVLAELTLCTMVQVC